MINELPIIVSQFLDALSRVFETRNKIIYERLIRLRHYALNFADESRLVEDLQLFFSREFVREGVERKDRNLVVQRLSDDYKELANWIWMDLSNPNREIVWMWIDTIRRAFDPPAAVADAPNAPDAALDPIA